MGGSKGGGGRGGSKGGVGNATYVTYKRAKGRVESGGGGGGGGEGVERGVKGVVGVRESVGVREGGGMTLGAYERLVRDAGGDVELLLAQLPPLLDAFDAALRAASVEKTLIGGGAREVSRLGDAALRAASIAAPNSDTLGEGGEGGGVNVAGTTDGNSLNSTGGLKLKVSLHKATPRAAALAVLVLNRLKSCAPPR